MKSRENAAGIAFACLISLLAACAPADHDPSGNAGSLGTGAAGRSRDGILAHLREEARAITDRAKDEVSSKERWEQVRASRLAELRDMLGLAGERERTPLNPQVTGKIEQPGYSVEKISFESVPNAYVTANLYLPADSDGPVPAVVYVCGHAYSPHGAKTSYQRHGHTLARHGYAAMVIDPVQIAETAGLHHGVLNQEMYEWYSRAYSPAGWEVWNIIRALDYLETRPEVDSGRFAITGRSGGAAMSWFAGAVEPRIKAVIPIMGIGTYAVSVADNTQRRHCDCMYPVNFSRQDMIHLGALIAPKPLLMAHGRLDPLFPVPGYEEFEDAISSLYASYGAADRFRNVVVESGHQDSDFLRAEAVRWLDRWIREIEPREIDTSFEEIDPSALAVFGGEPPEDARNHRMHELFLPLPERPPLGSRKETEAWRASRLDALKSTILPTLANNSEIPETGPGSLEAPNGFEALSFRLAGHLPVEALLRMPEDARDAALLHVASPGEDPPAVQRLLRDLSRFGRNPVLVVYPPGTGAAVWTKSEWKMLLRNAMQTGRTVDSIRIGTVLAAARLLRERAGSAKIAISGIGPAAGWAVFAAALDQSIAHVILIAPPDTHRDSPIVLGALRHADLPGFTAALAPRRLTFYGGVPAAYADVPRLYEAVGAVGKASESMSIGAALNGRFGHGFAIGL